MNLCMLIGKIISNIKFEFIINSKNVSIVQFDIQLNNNSIVKIKAYNEIADLCYRELIKGDIIYVLGEINSNMEIILYDFEHV